MRLLVGIVVWLIVAVPVFGGELTGVQAFNTGAFPCAGTVDFYNWENNTGRDLQIKKVDIWQGMTKGGIADFIVALYRAEDGAVIAIQGWDHYAEPTAQTTSQYKFSPDYVLLRHKERLSLHVGCSSFSGPDVFAHSLVVIHVE
jgi:hypothetical protein